MASQARVIVVLNAPKGRLAFVEWVKHVLASLTTNLKKFSTLDPPLPVFQTHVEDLDSAHVKTLTRARGTVSKRDAVIVQIKVDLGLLRACVQRDCAGLEPDAAAALAHLAGMSTRVIAVRSIPELELRQTEHSGVILAIAKGAKGMAHYWEYRTGEQWQALVPTKKARIRLPWIAPGTTVYVRHRLLKPKGVTDWCSPVSIVVQ